MIARLAVCLHATTELLRSIVVADSCSSQFKSNALNVESCFPGL